MKDVKSLQQSIDFYSSHTCSSSSQIKKVCVIGSGVMGSKIAALVANASIEVVLLDVLSSDDEHPNKIAVDAVRGLLTQNPSGFTDNGRKSFITVGNLIHDLHLISECDLIIEAIIETLEIKGNLYSKITPYLKDEAIIASNTSTIPLRQLKQYFPKNKSSNFLITHFFNPPRFAELVELVIDEEVSRENIQIISKFITDDLGKTIVQCNDTPGFIANRIGCFLLELVVRRAISENLNPIIIDNIFNQLFGLPKTGIFGLYDLIGHDVLKLISVSLIKNLPSVDMYNDIYLSIPLIDHMLEAGLIGRKSESGFYRYKKSDKTIEVIDFAVSTSSNVWQPNYCRQDNKSASQQLVDKIEFNSIEELLTGDGKYSVFFREVLVKFYTYISTLIPSVASRIEDINLVMKLGYNWKRGPFEILYSSPEIARLVITKQPAIIAESVSHINTKSIQISNGLAKTILSNASCCLRNEEGNLVFAINTKMNCLNQEIFDLLLQSVDYAESINQNLYIYSHFSPNFSAGADLKVLYDLITAGAITEIDKFLQLGQKVMMKLKYSTINIISCAKGFALGGGCELLLHSDWVIAHSELKAGLVEVGVGLIASWGGVKEIFLRSQGQIDLLVNNIRQIINYNKSSSADNFAGNFALTNYKIVMNKDQLLSKAFTLEIPVKNIIPRSDIILPDIELINYFELEQLTKLQQEIISYFQQLIKLKNINEQQLLDFERKIFIALCAKPDMITKIDKII
ncbi:MAG: 3-hydroxyacyl-CoA dehydrogenase/enoyl-CoA hydratase family protein [Rickettsiaceae bacterium]|nr:MAG: 3-hydroxyacyl-CoA dehydrogenase/enoyl-CoA hydratase family protein [Rickettsiaceae bacterium]